HAGAQSRHRPRGRCGSRHTAGPRGAKLRQHSCSIIVPTLNRQDLLTECLSALAATAPAAEVLVVCEGLSFGEHCNLGARRASGDYLVYLNDDTAPQPGWLDALLAPLKDPRIGIVGCRLAYPDGRVQHAGVDLQRVRRKLVPSNRRKDRRSGRVEAVTGACL